jgi:hypothetical protein
VLENFIFENHLGQKFIGLDNGVYANSNELRNYSWDYDTINNRISRFYHKITKRKIPLVVHCNTEDEAMRVRNRLMELAEADIDAVIPGKVFVGDYYTVGYITVSKKKNYLVAERFCNIELTLTSDDPAWYREQTHTFLPDSGNEMSVGGGTDYPYDYKYDYAHSLSGQSIYCGSAGSNAFRLLIYGETINPTVIIGGHAYTINGAVSKGETLLIDSVKKTITLTTATGSKANWFSKRGRESYVFEPIPAGQNSVVWSGAFGFDLTVIEKRSEPKWI